MPSEREKLTWGTAGVLILGGLLLCSTGKQEQAKMGGEENSTHDSRSSEGFENPLNDLVPLGERHEELSQQQKDFSERLASCVQDRVEESGNAVVCELMSYQAYFPGEHHLLEPQEAFPPAYRVSGESYAGADFLNTLSVNEVVCIAYNEAGLPFSITKLYAGPIRDATYVQGFGPQEEVFYGILSTSSGISYLADLGFPSVPYDSNLLVKADMFETIMSDDALDTLCTEGADQLLEPNMDSAQFSGLIAQRLEDQLLVEDLAYLTPAGSAEDIELSEWAYGILERRQNDLPSFSFWNVILVKPGEESDGQIRCSFTEEGEDCYFQPPQARP